VSIQEHHFVYAFPDVERLTDGQIALSWPDGEQAFNTQMALQTKATAHLVRCLPAAFSAEECRHIIALGNARAKTDGILEDGSDRAQKHRVSQVAWIEPNADTHWLYHRLAVVFQDVNVEYGFDLRGLVDLLQYTLYGQGQHFDWHVDIGAGRSSVRKLSMTIQLTDEADYEGGKLEFLGAELAQQRTLGAAIVFPSMLAHRVSPVTAGLRRSLVVWACGPTFR
jgi:PKHD-type hydroxylase